MALLLEQIQKLVADRPRKNEINRAIIHHNKLKFHTETEIVKNELSPYYRDFINFICSTKPELLPKDKAARFDQLLTVPIATVQLTESIGIALSRVFEGQDAFHRYDFDNPEISSDWEKYKDNEFWKTDGFNAMINAVDSIWVVDLPEEQTGDLSEPKNMLIDPSYVIDILNKPSGDCLHVIFYIGERLFVYDDTSIRVFNYKSKVIGALITEFFHNLGYCPARSFWTTPLKRGNLINKKGPLTNVLSELDWALVHKIFKKYMDIANSFPITVRYVQGDDFTDLTREQNKGRGEAEQKTMGGDLSGPGSIIEMPMPIEGQPDLMNKPVQLITPDIETLTFHVQEDVRLSDYIYKTVVGIDGEQSNDQAKNEKQVLASFESQSIILRRIAYNFEKIQSFADRVIIALRYGVTPVISIDYGSRFFLKTSDDLVKEQELVRSNDIMNDAVGTELIETKFRNDPSGKIRAKVINDLDPLPGKTIEEAITILDKGGISEDEFRLKSKLMNYVRRFEREQLPIAKFMSFGDYDKRLEIIKKEFEKYSKETKEEPEEKELNPDGTPKIKENITKEKVDIVNQ